MNVPRNQGQFESIGPILSIKVKVAVAPKDRTIHRAIGTQTRGFEAIKHWASEKPLHRRGDQAGR